MVHFRFETASKIEPVAPSGSTPFSSRVAHNSCAPRPVKETSTPPKERAQECDAMSMLPARQVTFSATTVMVFPAGKLKSALPSRSFMSPLFSTALRLGETLPTSAATANAPLPLAVPAKAGLLTNSKPRRRSRAALISPSPCHQLSGMVPQAGLEPARSCEQQILSLPRLPIPPLGLCAGNMG